jgi:eukaryotic-like serine/threonine-protein kinase
VAPPIHISHYELLQPIGRDGPTEIYRARDLRLDREVAVKLLRPEEMARPAAVERFRREARIASLVTHPHVCAVHDSGEESGQAFLVCELLEGRALDELMGGSPLPASRLVDIAIQLADALAAAHRRGITHGNLKPSNVFITTDGHVKLLELGAAGAAATVPVVDDDTSSRTMSIELARAAPLPTGEFFHPYLAPEQVAGRGADHRSDVFAIGALLYEMATGTRAFTGDALPEIVTAITTRVPAAPRSLNPALPPGLEGIVERALEKDPERRYQTAGDLLDDLRAVRNALAIPEPPAPAPQGSRRAVALGAIAVSVLALAMLVGAARWWGAPGATAPIERSTVMVSHIANGTADPDFDGTLRQAVTVYLAQSPYLDLASDERIRRTLQLMGRPPDARMTHEIAREVCQRLGLQALLEGSVSAMGRSTVVALVATDCLSGSTIARQQVEVQRKEDVLRAMGQITAAVRTSLGESGASLERHSVPIEEATTPSLEALKAYTEAVALREGGAEMDAIASLDRAIAIDPRFALAHTTLSSIYGGLGETGRSEEYAKKAYDHREHVSERERLFITYQYHDRNTGDQFKAREALDVWKRTYPRDYRPANALAVLLNRLGDYDGAVAEAEEAMRRNPEHAFPHSNLAFAHRGAGRYGRAREIAGQAIARGIETLPMRRLLYQMAELEGNSEGAAKQLDWAATRTRGFDIVGARAQVLAFGGQLAQARTLYRDTVSTATRSGFAQVASGYAAQAALTESLYGNHAEAIRQSRTIVESSTAFEPRLRAAAALALAGEPADAEAVLRRLRTVRPEDTLLNGAYLPVAEAAVQLARGRPEAALEPLRRAMPYQFGMVAALVPPYLRGEALRRTGAVADALREFEAVLSHRGAEPFSPVVPLAQLGLARALAQSGRIDESRKAYETLLSWWRSADPDLTLLREARADLARLTASSPQP